MSRHDIAVTMMTMDRSPRTNYLPETLDNFARSGAFRSERFHTLHIVDSGSPPESEWPDRGIIGFPYVAHRPRIQEVGDLLYGSQRGDLLSGEGSTPGPVSASLLAPAPAGEEGLTGPRVVVHRAETRRVACLNAAAALRAGLGTGAPWILFCEDDLDFCGEFMDSVGRWLDLYGDQQYKVFAFGCAYPQIVARTTQRAWTWEYPVKCFYGTQCFAIRREDAVSLAAYWNTNPIVCDVYSPSAYDLMLQDWHRLQHPALPVMLASAPSFVQHIGRDSIATSKTQTHTFASWQGKFWCFRPEVVV